MRNLLLLVFMLVAWIGDAATIKLYTDYPSGNPPVDSDFWLFQRGGTYVNATVGQTRSFLFNNPVFTGNGSINGTFNVGSTLTVGGAVITGVTYYGDGSGLSNVATQVYLKKDSDFGTNETFLGITRFDEIDAASFFPTNLYTGLTNAPYLATDGDGKLITGTGLSPTNVLLSAGNNIEFTTNGSGVVTIQSTGTNTVDTSTNSLIVVTNIIVYSNLTVLQNIYVSTNFSTNFYSTTSYITNLTAVTEIVTNLYVTQGFITNLYASTNFSTNLFFVSGKGNTLIITNVFVAEQGSLVNSNTAINSAVITDNKHAYTNAANAHGVFTNSATGPPSFGLLQNTELLNSSLTIAGTANQVSVSGGGPVSLGGTATLSLPSPTIFPGKIAVTGITNTGETSMQGVETNTTMGLGVIHSDANGKRSSSLIVSNDITAGISPVLNLQVATNLLLSSVSSPTNGVSTASSIDFTLPEAVTNIAGAVSQTSVVNFNQTNINHAIRWYVNRTGSDQTITVGTWETDSGRQTATTYICTNNTTLGLMYTMYAGQFTNVASMKTFR